MKEIKMFKRFRLKLGISQTRFAKMLGLPRTTYQAYEAGRRKPNKTKEKEIKNKILEIERRLDKLDKQVPDYLIYLLDILIFVSALYILWGVK
jgi:DNA-binding XRE family transcriptional regulator